MLKITNNLNALHAYSSSTGIYLTPIYILERYIRAFAKVFLKNLLGPKRMQFFSLKVQYQKVLIIFFKNKTVKAHEIHMMSNYRATVLVSLRNIEKLHQT